MLRKNPPSRPRIYDLIRADAKLFESDALTVKHAKNVMVRNDEEPYRIWKRLIFGKPPWIGVTVWAHQRPVANRSEKPLSDCARVRVRWKEPILVEKSHEVLRCSKPWMKHYNFFEAYAARMAA